MKINNKLMMIRSLIFITLFSGCSDGESVITQNTAKADLGEDLFKSKELSLNKTMSCATCHDLNHAMIDSRGQVKPTYNVNLGGSLGDDNVSIGDRNAPTVSYASFSPNFHFNEGEDLYIGGQFLDGREKDLADQAKGPFTNALEMNMPTNASVVARVKAVTSLSNQLKSIYGADIFSDDAKAFNAIADCIAMFEKTPLFSPFDSKFDRAYLGNYVFTAQEAHGKALFEGKAMCVACHPIDGSQPLITDHSYDNLGVPENTALRAVNGVSVGSKDNGLGGRKDINDAQLFGAFRVSSLRNIAVTGPYMHNGVFKSLKTVVHFYNTRDTGGINPETTLVWKTGEVELRKNTSELGNLGLSTTEEAALVAFMETFTDEKFEALIP